MQDRIAEAMGSSSLFEGIFPEHFDDALAALHARKRSYMDGELLLRIGDRTNCAGVVVEGRVRIDFYDQSGTASTIAHLGCSGTFGEAIACSGDPSIVQVQSVGDSRVLWIDLARMMTADRMQQSAYAGRVMANAVRLLSRKNMMLNRKMQMLAQKRLRDRIKLYLLQCETRQDGSCNVGLKRAELAQYLSVDRSALSRELGKMRDEGLIALSGGDIRVIDAEFLRA